METRLSSMMGGNKTSPVNNVDRGHVGSMIKYPHLVVTKNHSLSILRCCQRKPMESQNFHHCPEIEAQGIQQGGILPLPAREVSVVIDRTKESPSSDINKCQTKNLDFYLHVAVLRQ